MNSQDEGWVFWEQPVDEVRSLNAFLATEAVRKQGDHLLQEFVFSLLRAVHEEKKPVHEVETIKEAAGRVQGLDVDRMLSDMGDPDLREKIAGDYREGVDEYGVFGTPTALFDGGDAIFLKMSPPPQDEAPSLFEAVRALSLERPYVRELKKPRKPEPSS